MNYIKINNQILSENDAKISVKERLCRFGDGVFASALVTSGIMYNFEAHARRLELGLQAIKINFDIKNLKNSAQELITKNNLSEGMIRISISRGIGSAGYFPSKDIKPLLIIETNKLAPIPAGEIKLWVSSLTKISLKSLPINYKLSQGLNSTLAAIEARENNCFDSLLLNDRKKICETTCANIFWIKNNILHTPSERSGLLAGTTREKIIELSKIKVKKVSANLSELFSAQEIFITNSRFGVLAIDKILLDQKNEKTFSQKKYSKIFSDLLKDDILNYVSKESTLA